MKIPVAPDVAAVVGDYAQKVENRSLLLGKFVAHKAWPLQNGVEGKWDDATRWNFLRVAGNGDVLLQKDEASLRHDAENRNGRIRPEKVDKAHALLPMIKAMRQCACRELRPDVEEIRKKRVAHWRELLAADETSRRTLAARLEARLALNLSGGILQNAGICLDRLFGAPYIPGSAVKGVCRKVALEKLRAGTMDFGLFVDLFGVAESDFKPKGDLADFRECLPPDPATGKKPDGINKKGAVVFLPAYPQSAAPIAVDLTTVHFPDYYRTGREADLANERQKPNPFPVVEKGTVYVFAVALDGMAKDGERRKLLLDTAVVLLHEAVENAGVGAKTGAGYGWFSDIDAELTRQREIQAAAEAECIRLAQEEEARQRAEEARRESLSQEDRDKEDYEKALDALRALPDEQFANFAKELANKSRPEILACAALLKAEKRDRWKTWKKKKAALAGAIKAAVQGAGEELP
jgi:CRISPR type III-B/RAMP module RAMP protein Cmr6